MAVVRRAILSVSDKSGLVELARELVAHNVEILSTGGTARALADAGVAMTLVSQYTGAPEILGGRVKTLHPIIHGGVLARATDEHARELEANGIGYIDLVVVNLYPFAQTVAKPAITHEEAVENIDIGGPTMVRAAAKNHERVTVVVDPGDYARVMAELETLGGQISAATRRDLAAKAFAHTAQYDAAIAAYFCREETEADDLPARFTASLERVQPLRYGENPHQRAAFYRYSAWPLPSRNGTLSLPNAKILQGKELSYNNLLDLDAALACANEFSSPCAVVVKHTNPCGVSVDHNGVAAAYRSARACDPASAFGGIVAVNREVDKELADELAQTFLECVIAPSFSAAATDVLATKKNLRLVALATGWGTPTADWNVRSVAGGLLLQSSDNERVSARDAKVVTKVKPSADVLESLDFAWHVVAHVKSNAIVFCHGTKTAAVGAGQMSRVDSTRVAQSKAQVDLAGTVVASDAFFPFRDGVDILAGAGATAIIQPGGSIRDDEVIAAADEHGVAMLFTGTRHFKH